MWTFKGRTHDESCELYHAITTHMGSRHKTPEPVQPTFRSGCHIGRTSPPVRTPGITLPSRPPRRPLALTRGEERSWIDSGRRSGRSIAGQKRPAQENDYCKRQSAEAAKERHVSRRAHGSRPHVNDPERCGVSAIRPYPLASDMTESRPIERLANRRRISVAKREALPEPTQNVFIANPGTDEFIRLDSDC